MNHRPTLMTAATPLAAVAAIALAAVVAAFGMLQAAQAGATPRPPAPRHGEAQQAARPTAALLESQAQEAFVAGRYAEAYGRYAALADEGHAPAAFMALLLVANGPAVFGGEWSATPGQLQRWRALASSHAQERSAMIPLHDRGE